MEINNCPICDKPAEYSRYEKQTGWNTHDPYEKCGCPACNFWIEQSLENGNPLFTIIQAWNEVKTFPRGLLGDCGAREIILNYPYYDKTEYSEYRLFNDKTIPRWLHSLIDRTGKSWVKDVERKDKEYETNGKAWQDYASAIEYFYKQLAGIEKVDRAKIMMDYMKIMSDNKTGG